MRLLDFTHYLQVVTDAVDAVRRALHGDDRVLEGGALPDLRAATPHRRSDPAHVARTPEHTSPHPDLKMLIPKYSASASTGQVAEPWSTKNATNGGSSETEVKEPTVIPVGPASAIAVMIETLVGT